MKLKNECVERCKCWNEIVFQEATPRVWIPANVGGLIPTTKNRSQSPATEKETEEYHNALAPKKFNNPLAFSSSCASSSVRGIIFFWIIVWEDSILFAFCVKGGAHTTLLLAAWKSWCTTPSSMSFKASLFLLTMRSLSVDKDCFIQTSKSVDSSSASIQRKERRVRKWEGSWAAYLFVK